MPNIIKSSPDFFRKIKGDLLGGLTAGIVALPLALAFGAQSGMGVAAGLFGAIFIGFFAALLGGTPTQISGPTAPMTAVSMLVIQGIIQGNDGELSQALPYILMVFLMAGIFQVLLGLLKFGNLIKYIPYPVVSGFMTGIGVIIFITQLLPIFGYVPKEDLQNIDTHRAQAQEVALNKIFLDQTYGHQLVLDDFKETVKRAVQLEETDILKEARNLVAKDSSGVIGSLRYLDKAIMNINWLEFILAMATILLIYGFKKITTTIPSTLIALVGITAICYFLKLDVMTIGVIPNGFPSLHLDIFSSFDYGQIAPYILTAVSLALLGSIDSLLTSVVADSMTKTQHNSNKELIGQGIGNSIAALFGGIPGAGSTVVTVVNIKSGGNSRLSGMIAAVLLLLILIIIGSLAELIPLAVLAAILITVGISVMDVNGIKAMKYMPKADATVLIIVLLLTVFWDLFFAVAVGLVISSLIFMKKMADISRKELKINKLSEVSPDPDQPRIAKFLQDKVYIKQIKGPLFFGFSKSYQQLASKIPDGATTIIIKMDEVPYMDKSGFLAMKDTLVHLSQQNIKIILCGINAQPRYMLYKFNVIPQLVPKSQVFRNIDLALDWVREHVEDLIEEDIVIKFN